MNYFEGNEKSAEKELERIAEKSDNPAVFHVLFLIEASRKSSRLNHPKIDRLENKTNSLLESNMSRYSA